MALNLPSLAHSTVNQAGETPPVKITASNKALYDRYSALQSTVTAQERKIELLKGTVKNYRISTQELEREQEVGDARILELEDDVDILKESVAKLLLRHDAGPTEDESAKKKNNALNVRFFPVYCTAA